MPGTGSGTVGASIEHAAGPLANRAAAFCLLRACWLDLGVVSRTGYGKRIWTGIWGRISNRGVWRVRLEGFGEQELEEEDNISENGYGFYYSMIPSVRLQRLIWAALTHLLAKWAEPLLLMGQTQQYRPKDNRPHLATLGLYSSCLLAFLQSPDAACDILPLKESPGILFKKNREIIIMS